MKILFLSDGLSPFVLGGMQQHSAMLVKHLAPLVDQITLVHCGPINSTPPEDKAVLELLGNPLNVEIIGIPFNDKSILPGHYVRSSKGYSNDIFEAIKHKLSTFDVIYAQGFTGYAFVGKHKNLIVNLHGLEMFQKSFSFTENLKKIILRPLALHVLKGANIVVSLGGRLTDILLQLGIPPNKVLISPNGIDAKIIKTDHQYSETKSGPVKYIFIGRNEKRKGYSVLTNAISIIEKRIHLTIIGDFPKIESDKHTLNFTGLLTSKDEIYGLIDKADILISTSLSEGMPTVILEAMARGKAIIATDVGAVSTLVNEANGWLIEPNNLDDLIRNLNNVQRSSLVNRNHVSLEKANSFTWDKISVELLASFIQRQT